MYTISTEPDRILLRCYMKGFMTPEEVALFSADEQAAVARMGWGDGEFHLLIDTSTCTIQSQETVAAFEQIVLNSPRKARMIAVVRGTSLTRLQARRVLRVRDNAAVFDNAADAEAWLVEGGMPPARSAM